MRHPFAVCLYAAWLSACNATGVLHTDPLDDTGRPFDTGFDTGLDTGLPDSGQDSGDDSGDSGDSAARC